MTLTWSPTLLREGEGRVAGVELWGSGRQRRARRGKAMSEEQRKVVNRKPGTPRVEMGGQKLWIKYLSPQKKFTPKPEVKL